MGDLKNPRLIIAKGFLFLLLGCLAAGSLLLLHPGWREAALLAIAIWACSRFYYFAFYVLSHYVDPNFTFSGLGAFVVYFCRSRPPPP
jgi:hypothetical protein